MSNLIWIFAACKSLLLSPLAVKELTMKPGLTFTALWLIQQMTDIFSYFISRKCALIFYANCLQKMSFDISCKLSPENVL